MIEFIGAPMQKVLPRCETALKVYDTAAFGEVYTFPQDSVKLQKLIDQFRRYTDRSNADENKWSSELKDYIVAQAVGPMGIDNEAIETFGFKERRWSNANPGQPMPPPFLRSREKAQLVALIVSQRSMTVLGASCAFCTCASRLGQNLSTDVDSLLIGKTRLIRETLK